MKEIVFCGAVLFATLGLLMAGASHREAPLVGHQKMDAHVAELEVAVATHSDDAALLCRLSEAYLARGASGASLAAIYRAGPQVHAKPEVMHAWARTLLHQGQATGALVKEREAVRACQRASCPPWLAASAQRHQQFLEALVAAGVEDFRRDPEAVRLAYAQVHAVAVLDPER